MEPWRRLARAEAELAGDAVTVAGVDEVGRGPLAGPVVAAAVVLDMRCGWDGVNDSKKLSPAAREAIYARVLQEARAFAWAVVGPRTIDALNIRQASLEAMRRAVVQLPLAPDLVLVDGNDHVPGLACRQQSVISGDARLLSVAAARHKGYGTPEHLAALGHFGPCPLHRFSFAPVRVQRLALFT